MDKIKQLESFIEHVIATDQAVGMAVAVVNTEGETLYEKCFGYRDAEAELPYDAQTVQGMASVSKSFTALCVMQLAERGLVDLDAPVNRYIKGLKDDRILVRHLMSHIAGFLPLTRKSIKAAAEAVGLREGEEPFESEALIEYGLREMVSEMNAQTSFTGEPGEAFSYSNDSFNLLAEIVRRRGGEKSFPAYAAKNLFGPLGMDSSRFGTLLGEGDISRIYQRKADGTMSGGWTPFDDQSPLPGSAGVRSNLNDMNKYVLMYLNLGKLPGGPRIASERSIREMARPRVICDVNGYYGYGIMSWSANGMTVWGHGGDQPGVATQIDWSYESGIGCVVLSNTSGVTSSAVAEAAMRLFSGYPMERPSEGYVPVEWSDEKMDKVCGRYIDGENNEVVITKNGKMFGVRFGGASTIAYPINRYALAVKRMVGEMNAMVNFREDGSVASISGGYRIIPKVE